MLTVAFLTLKIIINESELAQMCVHAALFYGYSHAAFSLKVCED